MKPNDKEWYAPRAQTNHRLEKRIDPVYAAGGRYCRDCPHWVSQEKSYTKYCRKLHIATVADDFCSMGEGEGP